MFNNICQFEILFSIKLLLGKYFFAYEAIQSNSFDLHFSLKEKNSFVDLKFNSALLYIKAHKSLLTWKFPQKWLLFPPLPFYSVGLSILFSIALIAIPRFACSCWQAGNKMNKIDSRTEQKGKGGNNKML